MGLGDDLLRGKISLSAGLRASSLRKEAERWHVISILSPQRPSPPSFLGSAVFPALEVTGETTSL